MGPAAILSSCFRRSPVCCRLVFTRTKSFLSEDFKCEAAWQKSLQDPLIQKIDMNKYFYDIDLKFQREGRGSPSDIDLFATASTTVVPTEDNDWEILVQLEEVLRRFRKTVQTNQMLPGTQHAVVRSFLQHGDTDSLMNILNNPLEFGVFPDDYTLVYLLNHFLMKDNFRDAGKVAILMMRQEEYDIPLASQMGLYAAYSYAKLLPDQGTVWDPKPVVLNEPEEEVKVWVKYLETTYRDDHFDLTVREHLLGKTLVKFAQLGHLKGVTDPNEQAISKSLQLLGWALFEKWDRVLALSQTSLPNQHLVKECVEHVLQLPGESSQQHRDEALESVSKHCKSATELDVMGYLEECVVKGAGEHEQAFIDRFQSDLLHWRKRLDMELDRHYKLYLKEVKLKEMQKMKQELIEQEERLFFFDNYQQMERDKFHKFAEWRKTWPSKSWGKRIAMNKKQN